MLKIYLMVIIVSSHHLIKKDTQIDFAVFKKAEDCIDNMLKVRKALEKKYDQVEISCVQRDLN